MARMPFLQPCGLGVPTATRMTPTSHIRGDVQRVIIMVYGHRTGKALTRHGRAVTYQPPRANGRARCRGGPSASCVRQRGWRSRSPVDRIFQTTRCKTLARRRLGTLVRCRNVRRSAPARVRSAIMPWLSTPRILPTGERRVDLGSSRRALASTPPFSSPATFGAPADDLLVSPCRSRPLQTRMTGRHRGRACSADLNAGQA